MSPVPERRWETGAWVVGLAVNRAGTHAAAALGDGSVRLLDLADPDGGPRASQVHAGACLTIVPDLDDRGFLTGGDDGRLCRIVPGSSGTPRRNRWRRSRAAGSSMWTPSRRRGCAPSRRAGR